MKNHIKLYEEYTYSEHDFIKDPKTIKFHLDKFGIKGYTINDDMTVDVDGDVDISSTLVWSYCMIKFNSVKSESEYLGEGSFSIGSNHLQSLKGCPDYVRGHFGCDNNELTSLEYCPKEIGYWFTCDYNKLTSLVFASKKPDNYSHNPCQWIYNELGWTTEAHVEALLTLDPNPAETLRRLRPVYPDRYFDIISASSELREMVGESAELTDAYNTSKNVEGDFY